ncbi:MAG: SGNH/GDSL hydrolase family protein [Clostridia bacterium]|nr:SGNH/GDSL hydrolase family protein [Clostridia bacterium]MBQ4340999.1 SGNH/GDSL hydrolase family protein [Clostridia bacterium]MBR6429219.1 SGNH/GDSL hydrolase family protein [Clostridia bacterium]
MGKKLTILGDSIMKGVMYDADRGRYTLYGDKAFLEEAAGRGLDIKKVCRMGATASWGAEHLSEADGSSAVLLEFGGNDCNYDWPNVAETPDSDHDPMLPPAEFRRAYAALITRVREMGAEPICMNLPPIDAERFFRFISLTADGGRVLHWLGDRSLLYRWHEYYNRIIETTAAACGARLIDIRSSILQNRRYPDLIGGDGLHPSRKGHALIRSGLLDALSAQ